MLRNEMNSCTCDRCKAMCKRPCWPTPEEAEAMINAGLAPKMMLDYWMDQSNIYLVCPAENGYEGRKASWWPGMDGCVFQTPDGLCSIHNSGYKPYEGRMVRHDIKGNKLHKKVAIMWNSDNGRRVVEKWKNAVGQ